jgi:predicted nucleic-acid-binding Zn-ribbon protein
MSRAALECPKCQGEMIEGLVVNGDGFSIEGLWVGTEDYLRAIREGAESFWGPVGPRLLKRLKGKHFGTSTFRCSSCGYLESYARAQRQ